MRNAGKWEPYREQRGPSEAWGVRDADTYSIIVPASHRLDGEDADVIARSHNARLERPDQLWHESIVSHRTGLPVYRFQFGDVSWEFDLAQLRAFIGELYELLEAGLSDAFLARFVREHWAAGGTVEEQNRLLGHLMVEFRTFRETLRNPIAEADEGRAAS